MAKKIVILGSPDQRLAFFVKLEELASDNDKAILMTQIHQCKQSLSVTGVGFIILHHGDESFQFHISSTQERFATMFDTYIKGAAVAIALGDVNQYPSQIDKLRLAEIPIYSFSLTDGSDIKSIFKDEIDLLRIDATNILILGDKPAREQFYQKLRKEFSSVVNLEQKIKLCEHRIESGLASIQIGDLQLVLLASSAPLTKFQDQLDVIQPKATIMLDDLNKAYIKEAAKHPEIPLLSLQANTSLLTLLGEIRNILSYEEAKKLSDSKVSSTSSSMTQTVKARASDIWASMFGEKKSSPPPPVPPEKKPGFQDWQNPTPRPGSKKGDDDDL